MFAFEITSLDVLTVMGRLGIPGDEARAERFLDQMEVDEIEAAALAGDEMEEQTEYAYQEIERQLKELDI